MDAHVRDCLVTDDEALIPKVEITTFIEDIDHEFCTNRRKNVGKITF